MKNGLKNQYKEGSYTVEAALIIPMIMTVLAVFIYMIFYVRDSYVLSVYADRMAQECCWQFMEQEKRPDPADSEAVIGAVRSKYEPELKEQLLMMQITNSVGDCKKSVITHKYSASWEIEGVSQILLNLQNLFEFRPVVYTGRYERVHGRHWMTAKDLLDTEE